MLNVTMDTVPFSLQVLVSFDPIYCSDRSAEYRRQVWLTGGPPRFQNLLWRGHGLEKDWGKSGVLDLLRAPELHGLEAVKPLSGWSHIHIPGELTWARYCVHVACVHKVYLPQPRGIPPSACSATPNL